MADYRIQLFADVIELGCAGTGMAIRARLARRWGISAISLYLLGGLAFGKGTGVVTG